MGTAVTDRPASAERDFGFGRVLDYLPSVPLCGAITLVLIGFWLLRSLPTHYWLDETATYWTVSGGLKNLTARCVVFPLSIPYALLIMGLQRVFGIGEAVARIPSLIAIVAATFILFREAKSQWGSAAGWFAAVLFVANPDVQFLAVEARPYALALLFAVLSTSLLPRFFASPGYRSGALYALSAALMLNLHLLFGILLAAHFAYAVFEWRRGRAPAARYVLVSLALLAVLASPVALQLWILRGSSHAHSFAPLPGLQDLTIAYFPIPVMIAILGAAGCAILLCRDVALGPLTYPAELILAGLVAFIPPALCFLMSRAFKIGLFLSRYWISNAGGLAIVCGALIGRIRPISIARAAMLCVVFFQAVSLFTLISTGQGHTLHRGDWASAVTFLDRNTASDGAPVLMRSQYIESDFNRLDPVNDNPMFSQLSRYPSRSRIIGVSASLNERDVQSKLDSILNSPAFPGRMLLVSLDGPNPMDQLVEFVAGRLGPAFSLREIAGFDGVHVLEFRKVSQ
ncbi:MAG TPA: glycosyltransferase family 39 protein [Bryobacteraceae bacterium]|nr:glycosyltransferase family 39 protein [Bryobacteraceae bacterium]